MKRVLVASPYAGDIEANTLYAQKAMDDSLSRGEAPFVSHLLYPQVLRDEDPVARETAMQAGLEWLRTAEILAVYVDRGISPGMEQELEFAKKYGNVIELRSVYEGWTYRVPCTQGVGMAR